MHTPSFATDIDTRAALFTVIAERAVRNPAAALLSWEYLTAVVDTSRVVAYRRRDNPAASQPEHYIRISPSTAGARSVAYLIIGSAIAEILLTPEQSADLADHPAVTLKEKQGAAPPWRAHVDLTEAAGPDIAVELTRRALALETIRAASAR
ncbi:hypothetical protein [Streptomyces purpureus]|uniref:Uncharacterized protein n=1 Tax=Streptomyces purpureus TaxID=1951 RepID=A0A918HC63_9ACTN|nr:hypothetical protein GCM10014713_54340 [Streptomyces purpureus]